MRIRLSKCEWRSSNDYQLQLMFVATKNRENLHKTNTSPKRNIQMLMRYWWASSPWAWYLLSIPTLLTVECNYGITAASVKA
jgi:hypothetical protein